MNILFISPGSGDGYFCGNCYRDNLLAQAMHRAGHDVTVVPLYLPLKYLDQLGEDVPVFFQPPRSTSNRKPVTPCRSGCVVFSTRHQHYV